MDNVMIEFRNVSKTYQVGDVKIEAARDVNFSILEGEMVIVLGASGAGKTTVLNLLGGMDRATSGNIYVNGADITKYGERKMTEYRRTEIGFVFQFYNLITNLNVLENVEFAADVCKNHLDPREILERVNLSHRLRNFPSQLSGGEQQRVAIARAVAKNPRLLLCDEPTGALDYQTGKQVLQLIADINQDYGKTTVIITHNSALADIGNKVIFMRSGGVEKITQNTNRKSVREIEW